MSLALLNVFKIWLKNVLFSFKGYYFVISLILAKL